MSTATHRIALRQSPRRPIAVVPVLLKMRPLSYLCLFRPPWVNPEPVPEIAAYMTLKLSRPCASMPSNITFLLPL